MEFHESQAGARLAMPLVMRWGMRLSALFFGLCALVYVRLLLALLGNGHFTINGERVTGEAFVAVAWPYYLFYPLLLGVGASIPYAFWRERRWGRRAVMAYWGGGVMIFIVLQLMGRLPAGRFLNTLLSLLLCWACAALYFYGNKAVNAYYRALPGATDGSPHAQPAPVSAGA
jgi:hypothetical protein